MHVSVESRSGNLEEAQGLQHEIGVGEGNNHVHSSIKRPLYHGAGAERNIKPHPARPAEVIVIPAPAIVTEKQWALANEALSGRATNKTTPAADWKTNTYGLAGRVVHVHPDEQEFVMFGVARSNGERRYRCSASVPRRGRFSQDDPDRYPGFGTTPKNNRRTSVLAPEVEALFLVTMLDKLKDPASFQQWVTDEADRRLTEAKVEGLIGTTPDAMLAHLDSQQSELDDQRARIAKMEIAGRITEDQAIEEHTARQGHRQTLRHPHHHRTTGSQALRGHPHHRTTHDDAHRLRPSNLAGTRRPTRPRRRARMDRRRPPPTLSSRPIPRRRPRRPRGRCPRMDQPTRSHL